MNKTMGWASAMANSVMRARCLRTVVSGKGAEEGKCSMAPDGIEGIGQDIPKQKIAAPEKQVAGIDRTVGHDAKLCCACGTPRYGKLRIILDVGNES
jgi:hypothetical protein